MNNSNDELEDLYQEYWTLHSSMIDKGHDPLEIAAVITAQAMSIYKTALDPEEYDQMVDEISNMRYSIKELKLDEGRYH
jgi:hypothetical protein